MSSGASWATITVSGPCGRVVARWVLEGDGRADLGTVDQLARLQLAARRTGCAIALTHARQELIDLLRLAGLAGVVGGT